jgi:hypothetical protein
MLLEDLLSLPVGTRVFGEIEVITTVPGVVSSLGDGSRFIRWEDGYSTVPFGRTRDCDEYIAAHTQLNPAQYEHLRRETDQGNEAGEASVHSETTA